MSKETKKKIIYVRKKEKYIYIFISYMNKTRIFQVELKYKKPQNF